MATGIRERILELMPADHADVVYIGTISLTPDSRSYAYSYTWRRSDLYISKGLA